MKMFRSSSGYRQRKKAVAEDATVDLLVNIDVAAKKLGAENVCRVTRWRSIHLHLAASTVVLPPRTFFGCR